MRWIFFFVVLHSAFFMRAFDTQNCLQCIVAYNAGSSDELAAHKLLDHIECYASTVSVFDFDALVHMSNASIVLPASIICLFHKKYAQLLGIMYNPNYVEVASELMCALCDWEVVLSHCIQRAFTKCTKKSEQIFQLCYNRPYEYIFFYRFTLAQALKIFYFIYKRGDVSTDEYPERIAALYQKIKMINSCF